jgi:ParB family chromosome partitioning protein
MAKKKKQSAKLKVEYVAIDTLKEWDKNPRQNDQMVPDIVKSIENFGYTNPILVRRKDNRIIAGHTRLKAMRESGQTRIPVIFLDMSKKDADLYALFDNKSVENTPWDIPKLQDLFVNLQEVGADMSLTGFSAEEIAEIDISPQLKDSKHVMVFEVTEKQRQQILIALEDQEGETRTEKLMGLLKNNSKKK